MKWILGLAFTLSVIILLWEADWGELNLVASLFALVFISWKAVRFIQTRSQKV